jgi:hypothetical protein
MSDSNLKQLIVLLFIITLSIFTVGYSPNQANEQTFIQAIGEKTGLTEIFN